MRNIKVALERPPKRKGYSWRYRKFFESAKERVWHCHDEYELALHRHFSGKVIVSHHESPISHNHLMLVEPGVPHAVCSTDITGPQYCETHVVWFSKRWVQQLIACSEELKALRIILERADYCLEFSESAALRIFALLRFWTIVIVTS